MSLNKQSQSAQFAQFAWAEILKENITIENSPTIPDQVYQQLPDFLKTACEKFEGRERDVFLIGALAILSGCFPNVFGIYNNAKVFPNLFGFIIAPPASGKGVLTYAKTLGSVIHSCRLEETTRTKKTYQAEVKRYYAEVKKKKADCLSELPKEPPTKLLFIPANSSNANIIKLLYENEGSGIMCETEADTLVNSLKQEWGGYSDLLRKAFHHEPVTYSRKTNSEHIEIDVPKLSAVLSGTPSQFRSLIPSNADGLFSRFIYYVYESSGIWKDVFDNSDDNYESYFKTLGEKVFQINQTLGSKKIEIKLTIPQGERLNNYYATTVAMMPEEMKSIVFRAGLVAFRIAMGLTILRYSDKLCPDCKMFCCDADLDAAMSLSDIFIAHALVAYKALPCPKGAKNLSGNKMSFYESLPNDSFTRQQALATGEQFEIKERTVDKYLKEFVGNEQLILIRHGVYTKK
jgi:hypothetical protein